MGTKPSHSYHHDLGSNISDVEPFGGGVALYKAGDSCFVGDGSGVQGIIRVPSVDWVSELSSRDGVVFNEVMGDVGGGGATIKECFHIVDVVVTVRYLDFYRWECS